MTTSLFKSVPIVANLLGAAPRVAFRAAVLGALLLAFGAITLGNGSPLQAQDAPAAAQSSSESVEIQGLPSNKRLAAGDEYDLTVRASNLTRGLTYRMSIVTPSRNIGFDAAGDGASESATDSEDDPLCGSGVRGKKFEATGASETLIETLDACRAGNARLIAYLYEVDDDEGEEFLLDKQEVDVVVVVAPDPPSEVDPLAATVKHPSAAGASDGSATPAWGEPASNGGSAIARYEVEYQPESATSWTSAGSTNGFKKTISNLAAGTYVVQVRACNAIGCGPWKDIKVEIKDPPNVPPTFREGSSTTRSVPENTRTGRPVGNAVTATDDDNDTLTYSLSGSDARSFSVNTSTGQVSLRISPDYERKTSYTITITVSDGKGGRARITVTITISDQNEPPEAPSAPTVTAASTSGQSALDVAWSQPANNGPSITDYDVQYRKCDSSGNNCGDLTNVSFTGTGTRTTITGLSSGTTYQAQVRAKNAEGTGNWSAFSAGSTDPVPNREPSFSEGASASRTVPENTAAGEEIGTPVAATDGDNDSLTYALGGTDSASFSVNASTGQLLTSASLDYEGAKNSYAVTVSVSDRKDARGGADSATDDTIDITVTVVNVDEAGTVVLPASQPKAGVAFTAGISDPDGGVRSAVWSWERSADKRTWVAISGATSAGYTPAAADVGHHLRASATYADGHGSGKRASAESGLVQPTNAAPAFDEGASATRSVDENVAADANIGAAITATDDDKDSLTYALGGANAASFSIDASTGQLLTKDSLNYETRSTYAVTVSVSDGKDADGDADSATDDTIDVAIDVTNVEEAGTVTLSPAQPGVGAKVTASLADPDGSISAQTWTWQRSRDQADWTAIAGAGSDAYTPTAADADHYLQASTAYTDGHGSGKSAQGVSTSVVTTGNAPPAFDEGASATRSVAENTAADANIGAAVSADDGDKDTLTYALGGTDAASFSIDTSNGQLLTKAALDHETKSTYDVTVSVSDGKDKDDEADPAIDATIAVTVNVTNVDEAGTVTLSPVQPQVGIVVTASLEDPDGDISAQTWAWQRSKDQADWTTIAGAVSNAYTPVEADADHYLQASTAYMDGHGANKSARKTSAHPVQDGNLAPSFDEGASASRSIRENTAAGTKVGAPVSATDSDQDTLTYALGGTDAASFSIDTSTGQLLTRAALDHEAKSTFDVTVSVSDGKDEDDQADQAVDATIAITINVSNIDEKGTVTLSPDPPRVGIPVTANLTDPDGVISRQSWFWFRYQDRRNWTVIPGVNSHSYTPVEQDVGHYFEVTVIYTDGHGRGKHAKSPLTNAVLVAGDVPPTFDDGNAAVRDVEENTPADTPFDEPVAATDLNGDTLTYALGGPDAASFAIDAATGQLRTKAALDHETKSRYGVTVSVSDGRDADSNPDPAIDATIPVVIRITDEPPPAAPAAPSVSPAAAKGYSTLTVVWTAPQHTGSPITDYDIRYRAGDAGDFSEAPFSGTEVSATIAGLAPSTSYEVQVRSASAEGAGPWSSSGTGATAALTVPTQPQGLTLAPGTSQVWLRWDALGDESVTRWQYSIKQGEAGTEEWRDIPDSGPDTTSHRVTGLQVYHLYFFSIRAVNPAGNGQRTAVMRALTFGRAPAQPSGVEAAPGDGKLTLRWGDPLDDSITGYQISRQTNGAWSAWADIDGSDDGTTAHTVENLANGTAYTFAIRAVNSIGQSIPANVSGTPTPPPAKPTGLAAASGDAQVILSWNDPKNASITGYEYQQTVDGTTSEWGAVPGSGASTTSHAVTGLTNGVSHSFAIRAVNGAGPGPSSDAVSTTPVAVPAAPPSKPTGLTAAPDDAQVALSWDDPQDVSITRYQYNQRTGVAWGAWRDIPGSGAATTSFIVENLTNGTSYDFAIRALNLAGPSTPSDAVTATPQPRPAKPTGLTAAPGDAQVTLNWNDPKDASITGYKYALWSDGAWGDWQDIPGSGADTTSFTVTGLTNGATYGFSITAVNDAGPGASSDVVTVTPQPRPAKPAGLTATPGNTRVTLAWDDPGDSSITRYQINRQTNGLWGAWRDISGSGAATTSFAVEGLTNRVSYTFAIRAVNPTGPGAPSSPVTATPAATKPAKPTGLTAAAGNAQVTLRWDDPNDPTITSYQYQQTVDGATSDWKDIPGSGPTSTSFTVSGLVNGAAHTFRIRAVNPVGSSKRSEVASATPTYPPGTPTSFSATRDGAGVKLAWDDPFDGTITKYQYRYNKSGSPHGNWTDIPGSGPSTTSYTVTGLTNGLTYAFSIRAVNVSGPSAPTRDVHVALSDGVRRTVPQTPPAIHPSKPLGLTAVLANDVLTLRWDSPADIAIIKYQYNVRCGDGWGVWTDVPASSFITTSFAMQSAAGHTGCNFTVRAVGIGGNSPPAEPASVTSDGNAGG